MEDRSASAPHIVVFPFLHQGHVIPALHLAVQLASLGATVTFVNTERNQKKFLLSHPSADFVAKNSDIDLRFATISDGLPEDFVEGPPPDGPPHGHPPHPWDSQHSEADGAADSEPVGHGPPHGQPPWDAQHPEPDGGPHSGPFGHGHPHGQPPPRDHATESFGKQAPALEKLIQDLKSSDPRVCCLVADEFMPWAGDVARNLKISWAVFWTSSAAWLCGAHGGHGGGDPHRGASEGRKPGPGGPGSPFGRLGPPPDQQDRRKAMTDSDCILVNACEELEQENFASVPLKTPVRSVGPLILGAASRFEQFHGGFSKPDEECIPWLDKQQPDSVLYISFGSRSLIAREQVAELARGIEATGKPFLWVEKRVENLPDGFRERTKDRGILVNWAPQRTVLAHKSVGAFMTHCGWNSILETMAKGVPMVLWPEMADQPTNRVLLEEKWKVGKGVFPKGREGEEGRPGDRRKLVQGSHVCEVVKEVMDNEEWRERARALSERAKAAIAPGGSSYLHLQAFLQSFQTSSQL